MDTIKIDKTGKEIIFENYVGLIKTITLYYVKRIKLDFDLIFSEVCEEFIKLSKIYDGRATFSTFFYVNCIEKGNLKRSLYKLLQHENYNGMVYFSKKYIRAHLLKRIPYESYKEVAHEKHNCEKDNLGFTYLKLNLSKDAQHAVEFLIKDWKDDDETIKHERKPRRIEISLQKKFNWKWKKASKITAEIKAVLKNFA